MLGTDVAGDHLFVLGHARACARNQMPPLIEPPKTTTGGSPGWLAGCLRARDSGARDREARTRRHRAMMKL